MTSQTPNMVAAFGYPGAKSPTIPYSVGCMVLLVLVLTLSWLIRHGLKLILRSCGEFLNVSGESIPLAIRQGCRFFRWRDPQRLRPLFLWLNFVPRRCTLVCKLMDTRRPVGHLLTFFVFVLTYSQAHPLQLEAFAKAISKLDAGLPRPKLLFVGSCRNQADDNRLQNLKDKAVELKVDGDVEFHKNIMYRDLVKLLGNAIAGIHSMTDEHFGISVVEYMAAGAIPIAHNSAGPKMDIVLEEDGQKTGFLAETVEEYADAILEIIKMPDNERLKMASVARKRAGRFSEQRFYEDFKAAVRPILSPASNQ